MMADFINALINPDVPFIRYALIACLLSAIPFGITGSFVVVKRMTYIAGSISHTALGGIGLALFLKSVVGISLISPIGGALIFALAAGLIISFTASRGSERLDTIIGIIWAVGMSAGLIFIHLTPGYIDPMSYLFGNILLLTPANLIIITLLSILITVIFMLYFNQLTAVSFDADFARTRGIKTVFFETLLVLLVAMTIIIMIPSTGVVLVIALLTIPAAIAGMFAKKMKTLVLLSILICVLLMVLGLAASFMLEIPTGSTIVLLGGAAYLAARIFRKFL